MTAALATEREYETTIIEAARLGGWLVHAERPARSARGWRTPIRGHAGWPDLFVVHPDGRALALELKRRPNRPTPEQASWLLALELAGIDARLVYVPDDLDALVAELVTIPHRT
jgi:hypothetical protein